MLLAVFEGVPQMQLSKAALAAAGSVPELLSEAVQHQVFESKGEAKKMIKNGGVLLNREKVTEAALPADFPLLHGKFLVVQKGRKNYYLLIVE